MGKFLEKHWRTWTPVIGSEFFKDATFMAVLWIFAALIVNPVGNFPLDDDFSYGLTVKHLLETGDYRPNTWFWPPFVTNALWGALFCLPWGFSFTALRFSSLITGFIGVVGCYVLVRELGNRRLLALLVALTLEFSPLYYAFSHQFMTDVTFTALAVWATVFLARSLKGTGDSQMVLGVALSVLATLSRQVALCIPLAFLTTSVLTRSRTPRATFRAFVPLVLCIGSFVTFRWWLAATGRRETFLEPKTHEILQTLGSIHNLLTVIPDHLFVALMYMGLFLLPVLFISVGRPLLPSTASERILVVCSLLIFVAGATIHAASAKGAAASALLMPVGYSVLVVSGIGPILLRDVILGLNHLPPLPVTFWAIVTVVSLTGAILLILRLSHVVLSLTRSLGKISESETQDAASIFVVLISLVYLAPILLVVDSYDEYLIPLIPFLAAGVTCGFNTEWDAGRDSLKSFRVAAFLLVGVIGSFSIGLTRDYLMWNRVRWEALETLEKDFHVTARDVDGGFEFNALYMWDPRHELKCEHGASERSCWGVQRDTYLIGFGSVPGYTIVKEYTYRHWLPPHKQKLVVLHKDGIPAEGLWFEH